MISIKYIGTENAYPLRQYVKPLMGFNYGKEILEMASGMTKEQVLKICKDKKVGYIRLWFTDILGQVKSFAITFKELEGALNNGMGFDGSSITGYQSIEESDMIAMPDPSTFCMLPWRPADKPVGRMICDVLTPDRARAGIFLFQRRQRH